MDFKIFAVDFDGTLCENKWPEIGEANEELIVYLKEAQATCGVKLILWTCRAGDKLTEAVDWCNDRDLWFDAVNENLPEVIEEHGGDCRKIFAHEYIDDRSCTLFKLPYTPTGIDDKLIKKLEEVFGFDFYDWQKAYLKGSGEIPKGGRGNGKTFAYCLRLLLGRNQKSIDLRSFTEINAVVDRYDGPSYTAWFARYMMDINATLVDAGLFTNVRPRKYPTLMPADEYLTKLKTKDKE